ncbi:CdaR family protein [Paenibacillus arenosi]|uniref:YbbR-like domain-containing protein YbbR n=1 Tax=Paenibacillus arenosi TaxID=2774142 RepID=A0ABR9AWL5_9BACL|nr:hypothetical protein [Paenibacillus arenosi]
MDKWLMNNNSAKIIALVLGVLLFAVVHHNEDSANEVTHPLMETRVIDGVKLQERGLASNLVLKGITPNTVSVKVSGKPAAVAAALSEEYKIVVDLTGYGAGKHIIPLRYDFPDGVRVDSLQPSMVTVVLEEVQTKQVDVVIKTEGTPKEGYKAGTPIVTPSNRVHVSLPTSRMTEVKSVIGMVNIDDASESVKQQQVKLTAYDGAGNEIKDAVITPSVVEVEVPITKPFKTVPLQVNFKGQLPEGLSVAQVTPSVNQITLYGPQADLDEIEFYDQAVIDLANIKASGQYTVSVKLTAPPNIEKMEPSEIQVNVVISEEKVRTLKNIPITLTGINDRLVTTITEPASRAFDITVVGSPAVIDAMQASDIQLIANVNDLPQGNHVVTLQVNLPRFVKLTKSQQFMAKVTIQEKGSPTGTNSKPNPEPNPNPGTEVETDAGVDQTNPDSTSNENSTTDPQEGTSDSSESPDAGSNSPEAPATDGTS